MRTKEFNKIKPYTYFLIRKTDNMKYHGVRWGNKRPATEDLGKTYFTSSKYIKPDFKKNTFNYEIKFVWTFNTIDEARLHEQKINQKILKKLGWLNKNAFPAIYNEIPTMLGKKHSIECKKKLSEWNKVNSPRRGIKHTEETKRKISLSGKGKKHTELSKTKMSTNRKGKHAGKDHKMFGKKLRSDHPFVLDSKRKKGSKLSEEQKIKISISRLEQKVSEATKVKLSKANTGEKNPMWGRKQSPETIAKLRTRAKKRWTVEARKNWSGNNHHNFGKTWSDSHKKKIGNSVSGSKNGMWGKKHSNHSIMKMSLSHKGHIPWNKGSKGLIVAWNKGLKLKQINERRVHV